MLDEPVLTIKESAALLKMSERTVYLMAKEGRLPGAVKLGGSWRVVQEKLLAWLDANSTDGDAGHEAS
jgi:excisionase family DNA binding protein